jgi:hypothetical protein
MKPKIILCLALVLSGGLFGCSTITSQSQSQNPESFDLEVALSSPYNRDFTMLTTIHIEKPFHLIATNGAITNEVSGTLHAPNGGIYPLDVTVSEWASKKDNMRDSWKLKLELGKAWGGGAVSSVVSMREITLRRHESIFKPK